MKSDELGIDLDILYETVKMKMPFGKYKNVVVADLPISYLEYFLRKEGFPKGKLGMIMSTVYEIKLNGLDDIFHRLRL